jgi:hypothetical protein
LAPRVAASLELLETLIERMGPNYTKSFFAFEDVGGVEHGWKGGDGTLGGQMVGGENPKLERGIGRSAGRRKNISARRPS